MKPSAKPRQAKLTAEELKVLQERTQMLQNTIYHYKVTFVNGSAGVLSLNGIQSMQLKEMLQNDWEHATLNECDENGVLKTATQLKHVMIIERVVPQQKVEDGKAPEESK